ncbi:MAG: hypothetical protein FWE19_05695 [Oscillospiraceae bacterium]|nr:hypothetical protein [Oscillospiraceae bacterium]
MNNNPRNQSIKELAAGTLKAGGGPSTGWICKRLRAMTARMRGHYLKVNQQPTQHPVDEWLCDNYYVLEKECKQSIKDISHLARRASGEELARFYALFEGVLFAAMPGLDDDAMAEILGAAGRVSHISESQFAFVPAAVKAVLLHMAYRAVFETRSEDMIRYAVVGMSKLTSIDFDEIVYKCSRVERILQKDPAGVYPLMDSDSRNYYRHLVATIARRQRRPEDGVAEDMLAACQGKEGAAGHIGHPILNHPAALRPRGSRGCVALVAGVVLPAALSALIAYLTGALWVGLLCFLPLWEILRTPIWQLAIAGVSPDFIPRMDLKKIESKPKSVVLVSTLIPGVNQIPALADRLCQLYYSNSDPDLFYCVLADFKEWDYPTDEKDDAQVAAVTKLIEQLNREHGNRFMLFLRGRSWNKTQKKYSGWERKRGAITEFIRFLKGEKAGVHTFAGDRAALENIKYIIALDADTSLLYECAQTLVCAAIHPLNRPVIGPDGVVVAGYGILAPKMNLDLQSAKATAFSRVMSGCGGVTAYDTREKDFYQDLFGESIFAGKGLIDVDVFHQLLSDRFPENQILSHDILEGAYMRVAFVSDVEMSDNAPASMGSWLSRLHRWIRGDWQNIKFAGWRYRVGRQTYQNPISRLSRYKLLDNLRRSVTPAVCLACLTAALFVTGYAKIFLALSGVLGVMFPSLWASAFALVSGGFYTLSRKFFTRTLPHAFELIGQGCFLLIMLPANSLIALDGALRALWRTYVSRKKLLEWTTAAQGEQAKVSFWPLLRRFWLPALFGVGFIVLAHSTALSLIGIAFLLFIPTALLSARPSSEDKVRLSSAQRDTLMSYNAAMWRYYEDFANAQNNYLPPDNIQQSPVYRIAHRTSPTNIGMMMLSVLAARDFDFIDTDGLYTRIERTLTSLERLRTWHGNLYNWYDTITLDTLKPEFVSSVDSGNFICSLVALAEGLREFVPEKPEIAGLVKRLEKIIDGCDLTVFYNKKKNLFSIGYDVPTDSLSESHYDFLASEARLTSYYAVARKIVGKKHWGSLIRTMSRCGSYAGAVSWTGTTFEYYMPHLLLPVYEGSLLSEALIYCLYCQKHRVRDKGGIPWGISESAFYAFDNNLNYQYKAHGVQKIGVKRYLDKELVISPYSTFLTISQNPNSAMANLGKLHKLGVYGRYGFFEAVDFTEERVGKEGLAVVRNYMAHHIGMSMVSSLNAMQDNKMQKRFMRNHYMRSAGEFLQEKIAKSTVVYDELKNTESRGEKHERPSIKEELGTICPGSPRACLLTNGEITHVMTDTGAGYMGLGEVDITRRSTDLLRRPQGVFTIARLSETTLSATQAPFFDEKAEHTVEHQEHSVTYYGGKNGVEVGVRCMMHPTFSCEQRQIVVKNPGTQRQLAEMLVYFEPVLSPYQDYSAHPAFSKLFVGARYCEDARALIFTRKDRDSTRNMHLAVGFLGETEWSYETRRELLMPSPGGVGELKNFHKKKFSGGTGVPDACCALRFDLSVPAGGQQSATLLLCAGHTEQEAISVLVTMRGLGTLDRSSAAKSLLQGNTLEGRLGSNILGQLLFLQATGGDKAAKAENRLGQRGLWPAGISGDLPIALVEVGVPDVGANCVRPRDPTNAVGARPGERSSPLQATDDALDDATTRQDALHSQLTALTSYLKLHASLRSCKVEFDLVVLYDEAELRDQLLELIKTSSMPNIVGQRGGVFLLHAQHTPPELITLLRASARHIFSRGRPAIQGQALQPYRPVELLSIAPEPMPDHPDLVTGGGAYHKGRFYVDKASPLPWCHILANQSFGTLVSDCALGYTWAVNSRENKLTPWYNDIATDNTGELLLLHDGSRFYSLTQGSRASFSKEDALYQGKNSSVSSQVRVSIAPKGCAKYLDVTLKNRTDNPLKLGIAYYIEPVLSVNRDAACHIRAVERESALVLHNPFGPTPNSYAAIGVTNVGLGEHSSPLQSDFQFTTCRQTFLSGKWRENTTDPQSDPCAAVIVPVELPAKGETQLRFVLSWGATAQSAVTMLTLGVRPATPHGLVPNKTNAGLNLRDARACGPYGANTLQLTIPDKQMEQFVNHSCPHQILHSRILGRTAFYQCGGAYGFRDQLQDAMAYALLDPNVLRKQILRCCAVQFEEGDVLHWWHPLPKSAGGLKGVRTRFSDDLLWLPLAAAEYYTATGDATLLDTKVAYLKADELHGGEQEKYIAPGKSGLKEDVYNHCLRAIERGHNLGEGGIPLIGCGDWNDGFSTVGEKGKGRSVWMAFFLMLVMEKFAGVCRARGDETTAGTLEERANALRRAVDELCWDGEWYIRAFFDDGEKMGAAGNAECSIDLLPQSFAVLAGMPDKGRVEQGLKSAYEKLVDSRLRLVRLFRESFKDTHQQPGYVKAYPEGIRENGGQYTHAAVWFAIALLRAGKREEGFALLQMLNPVNRASHPELFEQYKLEPYYIPADIYTNPAAPGRGGWSIYTGAASWYLRAVWEEIIGLKIRGDHIVFEPQLPAEWNGAGVKAEISGTKLDIEFVRGVAPGMSMDGKGVARIPLDGGEHKVRVEFV